MATYNVSFNYEFICEAEDAEEARQRAFDFFCDKGYREVLDVTEQPQTEPETEE